MAQDSFARIEGLAELRSSLGRSGRVSRKAARLAINDTARRMRSAGSKAIRQQVNLKAKYVNERLEVSKPATDKSLTAVISGRKRNTLLYRYGAKILTRKAKHPERSEGFPALGIPAGRKLAGVSVKVKKGGARKKMRGAFIARGLKKSGASAVAIPLPGKYTTGNRRFEALYGPSVHQVWTDVREELAPEAEKRLSAEFRRQLKRLL